MACLHELDPRLWVPTEDDGRQDAPVLDVCLICGEFRELHKSCGIDTRKEPMPYMAA